MNVTYSNYMDSMDLILRGLTPAEAARVASAIANGGITIYGRSPERWRLAAAVDSVLVGHEIVSAELALKGRRITDWIWNDPELGPEAEAYYIGELGHPRRVAKAQMGRGIAGIARVLHEDRGRLRVVRREDRANRYWVHLSG